MLRAVLCGEFLLHPPLLFHVGSFSLTCPCVLCGEFVLHAPAVLCGEFLLHAPCCCFLWGVSLTALCCFMCGVSLKRLMLFYVGSFSYTPLAVLCGEFHVHASCCVMWGVSLTRPLLCYVGSFSYTPLAVLCGQFLLYAPCFFFFLMRGVTLTHPRLFNVWRFSCKLFTFVTRNLTKQCKNQVCWVKSVYRASDQASVSCHQNDTANEPNGSSQSITD